LKSLGIDSVLTGTKDQMLDQLKKSFDALFRNKIIYAGFSAKLGGKLLCLHWNGKDYIAGKYGAKDNYANIRKYSKGAILAFDANDANDLSTYNTSSATNTNNNNNTNSEIDTDDEDVKTFKFTPTL